MTSLPREMIKWLQTLDLSVSVKNPKRDFANGFVIGEIFGRYFPREVSMHTFDTGTSQNAKSQNWEYLNRFFVKQEIPITPQMIDDTMNVRPLGTQQLLDTMYSYLTNRPAPTRTIVPPSEPARPFARPTANVLIKEHEESMKIQDTTTSQKEAQSIVSMHQNLRQTERALDPSRFTPKKTAKKGQPKAMSKRGSTTTVGFKGVEIRSLEDPPDSFEANSHRSVKESKRPPPRESPNELSQKVPEMAITRETVQSILARAIVAVVPSLANMGQTSISAVIDSLEQLEDQTFTTLIDSICQHVPEMAEVISQNGFEFYPLGSFIVSLLDETVPSNRFFFSCRLLEETGRCLTQIDPINSRAHLAGLLPRLVSYLCDTSFDKTFCFTSSIRPFADGPEAHLMILKLIKEQAPPASFARILLCYASATHSQPDLFSLQSEQLTETIINYIHAALSQPSPTARCSALQLLSLYISSASSQTLSPSFVGRLIALTQDNWWQVRATAITAVSMLLPLFVEESMGRQNKKDDAQNGERDNASVSSGEKTDREEAEQIGICVDCLMQGLQDVNADVRTIVVNHTVHILFPLLLRLCPSLLPEYSPNADVQGSFSALITSINELIPVLVESALFLSPSVLEGLTSPQPSSLGVGDPHCIIGGWSSVEVLTLAEAVVIAAHSQKLEGDAEEEGRPIPFGGMQVHLLNVILSPILESLAQLKADDSLDQTDVEQVQSYASRICLSLVDILPHTLNVNESPETGSLIQVILTTLPHLSQQYLSPTMTEIKEVFLRSDSTDEMKQQAAELCNTLRQLQSTSEDAQAIFISFPPFVQKSITG
ncbi:putative camsap CH domain protein [Blattamonas nauphoetae]|uniref:Camsap CH domain protein n=1 Tax=Blattamonas nauphoetae TaxID=2049346 RepID=A0ABQ9X0C8_9EUKA|nr:putative camsap CH domain protein [Blattamonas nauphoetae]